MVGGKYLVQRRDGTVPEWPWFVLGGADPAAPAALRAYADAAEALGMDPKYVGDVRDMAGEWDRLRESGAFPKRGDPDAPPHRTDDPETVAKMAKSRGA